MALGDSGLWIAPRQPVNPFPFGAATKTVYVSTLGSDTNPGTQAQPFATIARALQFRRQYSTLYAGIVIQLVGAGPYAWPFTGGYYNTISAPAGFLSVLGDPTADTIFVTSTFTGDFSGASVPTAPGLGVGTQASRFLRITSGNCSGAIVPISNNTDTSITPVSKRFRSLLGAIANGDTFQIFVPGTTINTPLIGVDWIGGANAPLYQFHNVAFTSSLSLQNAAAAFSACLFSGLSSHSAGARSNLTAGISNATGTGLNTSQLSCSGLICTGNGGLTITDYSIFRGHACITGNALVVQNDAYAELQGLRLGGGSNGLTVANRGRVFLPGSVSGSDGIYEFTAPLNVSSRGMLTIGNGGNPYALILFTVNANRGCINCDTDGLVNLRLSTTPTLSGGNTSGSGWGINAAGGGKVYITLGQPALTGGAGDLHTTANTVPNATLNAPNTFVDAVASPLGDLICRLS